MAAYKAGVNGWVVQGSSIHHAMSFCGQLEQERRGSVRKPASHVPFDPSVHTACESCLAEYAKLPEPPRAND